MLTLTLPLKALNPTSVLNGTALLDLSCAELSYFPARLQYSRSCRRISVKRCKGPFALFSARGSLHTTSCTATAGARFVSLALLAGSRHGSVSKCMLLDCGICSAKFDTPYCPGRRRVVYDLSPGIKVPGLCFEHLHGTFMHMGLFELHYPRFWEAKLSERDGSLSAK